MSNWQSIVTPSQCLTKQQLLGYLQQTLERDEVYAIESHLNDCPFCNDALEGLMEADHQTTEQDLKDLEIDFQQKLQAQKIIQDTPRKPSTTEISKPPFTLHRTTRWLVAASLLFIVATGAYSVFSYISEQKKELALNDAKNSTDTKEVPYKLPEAPTANEITHVEINPDSLQPQVIDTKEEAKKEIASTPTSSITKEELKKEVNADKKQAPSVTSATPAFSPAPVVASTKNAEELSDYSNNGKDAAVAEKMDNSNFENYQESAKKPVEEKIVLAKKTKAGGFSKNKESNNAISPASNQLNYSSAPIQYNQNQTEDVAMQETRATNESYDKGVKLYQRGKYSKCIPLLESALVTSIASQKEDIYYYLAQAYFQTGNYTQSEVYINKLSGGVKYKTAAQEIKNQMNESRSRKK